MGSMVEDISQTTLNGTDPVTDWHGRHSLEYSMVEKRLTDTKAKFMSTDRDEQVDMLVKSYVNAVISQRNKVDIYEPAYVRWVSGEPMDKAFESIIYNKQKISWISKTLVDMKKFHHVADLLEVGRVNQAHNFMADNFTGLSHMKAAFTLAMLGFTSRMCLDTNVCKAMGFDSRKVSDIKDMSDYLELCNQIVDKFEHLELDPFVLQWVIFDYRRGFHETHKVFFQSLDTWSELDRQVE